MAFSPAEWLSENRDVYIGNATAVRDFRVQLRGNRSVMLFGIYLLILVGIAVFVYDGATGQNRTIYDAQQSLRDFYQLTMGLLGLAVIVVAPALTATTVVMERQRQSIDLIFSAPVSPKYFLVGKMISSFRYTWMLLVLALPVAAASVVLGGATWTDVLIAYLLLSLQGLILTAFALLISSLVSKPVAAIIWSYAVTFVYSMFALGAAGSADVVLRYGRGTSGEASAAIALSPVTLNDAARTYTLLGTIHVPNWMLMLVFTLAVTKLCLLGAGTLLSSGGGKEVIGLRIHSLIAILAMSGIAGWVGWGYLSVTAAGSISGSPLSADALGADFLTYSTVVLVVFLPFIACYGFDRDKRLQPNGLFSLKHIFDGTPGGGLPYLLAMIGCLYGGFAIAGWVNTKAWVGMSFWSTAFFTACFWTLFWAIGRLASSLTNSVKTSRTILFAVFLTLAVVPYPAFVAMTGVEDEAAKSSLWNFYMLHPVTTLTPEASLKTLPYGVFFLVLSAVLIGFSERRTRQKLSTIRNYDEQPYQTA